MNFSLFAVTIIHLRVNVLKKDKEKNIIMETKKKRERKKIDKK